MAYTDPTGSPWAPGYVVTSTDLNTYLKNNMLAIAGTGGVFPAPHMIAPVVDSGGLTVSLGNVGIGAVQIPNAGIFMSATQGTSASQYGGLFQPVGNTSATTLLTGITGQPVTTAAVYTIADVACLHAAAPTKGAGSIITNISGVLVDPISTGATNVYGVKIGNPTGGSTANWGLFNAGGAQVNGSGTNLAFFAHAPSAQVTVTGSRGSNTALTNLMIALALYGLVVDSTS